MAASKLALKIDQGATFSKSLTWKTGTPPLPVDLTGYKARMQIRAEVTAPTVLLELTTDNGRIALGGADGSIELMISAVDTAAITWEEGVYDLELESPNGTVRRLIAGSVTVSPEITR